MPSPPRGKKRKAYNNMNSPTITFRKRSVFKSLKHRNTKRARYNNTNKHKYISPTYALNFVCHGGNSSYSTFIMPDNIELVKFTRLGQSIGTLDIKDIADTLREYYDHLLPINWKTTYNKKIFKSVSYVYGDHEISVFTGGDATRNQLCSFETSDWMVDGFYNTKKAHYDFDYKYHENTGLLTLNEVRVSGHIPRMTQDFKDVVLGPRTKMGHFLLESLVSYVSNQVPHGEVCRLYFFACDVVMSGMDITDMNVEGDRPFKEVLGL